MGYNAFIRMYISYGRYVCKSATMVSTVQGSKSENRGDKFDFTASGATSRCARSRAQKKRNQNDGFVYIRMKARTRQPANWLISLSTKVWHADC
jgi:hypothetical protein